MFFGPGLFGGHPKLAKKKQVLDGIKSPTFGGSNAENDKCMIILGYFEFFFAHKTCIVWFGNMHSCKLT